MSPATSTLTKAGEVVGTLAYMSPEQAEGELAEPGSDVYSLALTIYECFSGSNPIAALSPAATARRIGGRLPPLRAQRPDLPEGLTDTIDACLDTDPGLRPSARELAECLEAELDRLDSERPAPLPDDAPDAPPAVRHGLLRLAALATGAAAVTLLAGPLGAGGLALVVSLLALPLLALGAPAVSLPITLSPFFAYLGAAAALPALGAAASTLAARAVLGASAWLWMAALGLAFGTGPDLGIGEPAPGGWAEDVGTAASSVLVPLFDPASLAGAATFALAAVFLGWVLSARHAAIALLGAMLWAAALEASLALVAGGALAGSPLLLITVAALAVALEFGVFDLRRLLHWPASAEVDEGELVAPRLPGQPA